MTERGSIYIDTYECSGCGSCVVVAPELFRMNVDREKAEVLNSQEEVSQEVIEQAIAICPTKCIRVAKE